MPVQPKLRRIVGPPGPPPQNIHNESSSPIDIAHHAVRSHLAKSDPASCASDPPILPSKMQLITVHPSQPLVAYYMEQDTMNTAETDNNNNNNTPQVSTPVKLIQVQHLQTRNVLWTCYLSDLACALLDYNPLTVDAPKRFPNAMKALGTIQSMQFFDPSTLYFSGMADPPTDQHAAVERWQTLLVQFDRRVVLLNLRKGPSTTARLVPTNRTDEENTNTQQQDNGNHKKRTNQHHHQNLYAPILCHLTKDAGLNNSPPSSNALPLTKSLLLLGCADGTFKCYDWKKGKLQKSIKGLGKNDWIVHLIAANRYPSLEETNNNNTTELSLDQSAEDHHHNHTNTSSGQRVRRFITVTKKSTAYLIEVVVGPDGIDIRPPLARFEGGASPSVLTPLEDNATTSLNEGQHHFEHQLLNYDPDRDIFMWGLPSTKSKQAQKVFCWDLQSLQDQFQAEKGGKSVYKPEPTLVIQFPFEGEVAAFPAWNHSAFPDDAIVCAVVTKKGDLYIMGATRAGTSGSATILASAITSTNIRAVIQRDTAMVTLPLLQIHYVGCASLWDSGVLLLGSNLGVVMVDFEREYVVPGARHNHFGAGLGSLGKSVLFVKHSSVVYGSVDAFRANPVGRMEIKNTLDVYESPAATHLPVEIQKRPFRLPPSFLPSPSGMYLCLFWGEEMRYEVLHLPSVLQRVSNRGKDSTSNAAVASGTGVSSFAWIGENDLFAVIHSPDADKLGQASILDAVTPTTTGDSKDFAGLSAQKLKDLADIRNLGQNFQTLTDVKGLAVNTTKGAAKVVTSTAKVGGKVANAVSGATANVAAGAVHKTTKFITFGGRLGGRSKKNKDSDAIAADEEGMEAATMTPHRVQPGMYDPNARNSVKKAYVELKEITALETTQTAMSGTIAPATASSLGELSLRGGNRIPPKVLFGGPVLCVGCQSEEEEGMAYFYTQKKGATEKSASSYASSGPSMPYPDLVVWDDDGKLCAVVIQSRVAVYLSDQPDFILLGTVRVGSPADPDGAAFSVRFIHGILYCCTRNSIEIVFLGDTSGGICHLDSLTLASTAVHSLPGKSILTSYSSLTPPILPMPLNHPVVLGYQSGSLIVSTVRGLIAIPLSHPLLRIGTLLAAHQSVRATKWFDAVPDSDHEELATFLERRGYPELATDLPGLSLETMLDCAMRYGEISRLEHLVEIFGVPGLRSIDMGRGLSSSIFGPEEYGQSVIVCVGSFLLAHGRVEMTRKLTAECLKYGETKKDAFVLASLLLKAEGAEAKRLVGRAVQDMNSDDWAVANYARNHIISSQKS